MKHHTLKQGSPEWHAHRAQYDNASDAPSMMGCSPYKTREQLIRERVFGDVQHVGTALQQIFERGHRFEEHARHLAELVIGEDLFPVVGTDGSYGASFDGLIMAETVSWEHKQLNAELRGLLPKDAIPVLNNIPDFPLNFKVQMEQGLMVCNGEHCLFTASEWDDQGNLLDVRHGWYQRDLGLRQQIIVGWEQFHKDCANYKPTPAAAVAEPIETLPAVLTLRVEGRLVASNLEQYKPAALAYIEGINTKLVTDQDFANAERDAKFCRESASKLKLAIEQALGEMGDVNAAISVVRDIAAAFDAKGLSLEKQCKTEKDERRLALIREFQGKLADHIKTFAHADLMPGIAAQWTEAVKGKRTIDGTKDALTAELLRCIEMATHTHQRIDDNLVLLAGHPLSLFPDRAALVLQDPVAVAAIVENRVRRAEEERVAKEANDRAVAEAAAAQAAGVPMKAISGGALGPSRGIDVPPNDAANNQAQELPTLTIGAISARLGFALTAEFIGTHLGIQPAGRQRNAVLYRESQWPLLCDALLRHVTLSRNNLAAKAA